MLLILLEKCVQTLIKILEAYFLEVKWRSLSCVWLFATHGLYSPWNFPSQNTGVGILKGILEPFSSLGDLPSPGIKLRSPTLQVYSLPVEPQGKPYFLEAWHNKRFMTAAICKLFSLIKDTGTYHENEF